VHQDDRKSEISQPAVLISYADGTELLHLVHDVQHEDAAGDAPLVVSLQMSCQTTYRDGVAKACQDVSPYSSALAE